MNVEKWFLDGFKFGFDFKRAGVFACFVLAVGILTLIAVAVTAAVVGAANYSSLAQSLASNSTAAFSAGFTKIFVAVSLVMLVLMVIWFALYVLIALTMMHAAKDFLARGETNLSESFSQAKSRVWGFLGGAILIFIVSFALMLLRFIPAIGSIVYFLALAAFSLSLVFWCYYYVFKGTGVWESLKSSASLFARKPLKVLAVFFIEIFALVVLGIALVVLLLVVLLFGGLLTAVIPVLGAIFLILALAFLILFGFSFVMLFAIGFLASAFVELDAETASAVPVVSAATPVVFPPRARAPVKPAVKRTVRKGRKARR